MQTQLRLTGRGRPPLGAGRLPKKTFSKRAKQDLKSGVKRIRSDAYYIPAFAKAAKVVCAVYGSTVDELATFFRVDVSTIYKWLRDKPDFRSACENGATSANMTVMRRLYRQAVGFYYQGERVHYDNETKTWARTTVREYVKPSETAQIYWLNNRMPDKWKTKQELSAPDGQKLAGDLYQLFNVTVSPDVAIDTYNKLLQVEARAEVEFKGK
jgi:hypothetical protein